MIKYLIIHVFHMEAEFKKNYFYPIIHNVIWLLHKLFFGALQLTSWFYCAVKRSFIFWLCQGSKKVLGKVALAFPHFLSKAQLSKGNDRSNKSNDGSWTGAKKKAVQWKEKMRSEMGHEIWTSVKGKTKTSVEQKKSVSPWGEPAAWRERSKSLTILNSSSHLFKEQFNQTLESLPSKFKLLGELNPICVRLRCALNKCSSVSLGEWWVEIDWFFLKP